MDLLRKRIATYAIDCDLRYGHAHAANKPSQWRELCESTKMITNDYGYPHLTMLDAVRFREIVASRCYCGGVIYPHLTSTME